MQTETHGHDETTIIPNILHQLWIGTKPRPAKLMETWKTLNPHFWYVVWDEAALASQQWECLREIEAMQEINGKADIYRWEILHRYGGVFVDADSICCEPLDSAMFLSKSAFFSFENENVRQGLVSTGTMGFVPQHPLLKDIIQWIQCEEAHRMIRQYKAWYSVGPALLTRMLNTGHYSDCFVFGSHTFLPVHFTGPVYWGHKKVYAHQEWGTAHNSYERMNDSVLPPELRRPDEWVSILISSYNTRASYVGECLRSIQAQEGYFGMEIVWVNDGSDFEHTASLKTALAIFQQTSRWTTVRYAEWTENRGTRFSLNHGIYLCNFPLVFKMDSDDIMLPSRIQTQLCFMREHPDAKICGTNMILFHDENGEKKRLSQTHHPTTFTLADFMASTKKPAWFMNHPTLCFYKTALLEIGNYKVAEVGHDRSMMEDYEMEIGFLKKYGTIYNLPEPLLHYRVHCEQLTQRHCAESAAMRELREQIVESHFSC